MSSTSRPVILPRLRSILLALTLVCVTLAPAVRASAARASGPSGALTVDIVYEQSSLDPAVDYDSGTTYIRQVYDTLVSAVGERQVKIVPNLAPRWEQSSDGKTWTFHLRPGVR